MEPTRELIDEIYRERVLRARAMSPEEKFLAGPRLFEMACRITMDGHEKPSTPTRTRPKSRQILERTIGTPRTSEE